MTAIQPTTVVITPDGKLTVTLIGDAIELWNGLRGRYLTVRPAVQDRLSTWTYPETTYDDIVAIVEIWERAFDRDFDADLDWSNVRVLWKAYLAGLARTFESAPGKGSMPFPDNRDFWMKQTRKLSEKLAVMRVVPTRTSIAIDAFKSGVESYYGGLLHAALHPREAVVGAARAGAELIGDVADASTRPWRKLLGGWKVPLLIGAGVVAAIVIGPPLLARRAPTGAPRST
jgi:hypothetical protein